MPEPITPELMQQAVRGSQPAFRAIVETHQGFVYAVAFRFVNVSTRRKTLHRKFSFGFGKIFTPTGMT